MAESVESPFVSVNFHLIKSCNEQCKYCFATFGDIRDRLATAEAKRLILQLSEHGLEKLTFVGGEPTLHPDLTELIRFAHSLGITVAIVTNGARLVEVLAECADAVSWAGLSVDSGDEATQQALGRGKGTYVAKSVDLAKKVRALGIRLKLNTVVTSLNWQEDMSELVRTMRPERWKVFQVLPLDGQNDGSVEEFLITKQQFDAFVARHTHLAQEGLAPVPEDNDAMTGSYLMVDPLGRFADNTSGSLKYSRPILQVGPKVALDENQFSLVRLVARNGVYSWRR